MAHLIRKRIDLTIMLELQSGVKFQINQVIEHPIYCME